MGDGQGAWPPVQGRHAHLHRAALAEGRRALSRLRPHQGRRARPRQAHRRDVRRGHDACAPVPVGASRGGAEARRGEGAPDPRKLARERDDAREPHLRADLRHFHREDDEDRPQVRAGRDRHRQGRPLPPLPRHLGHRLRDGRQDRAVRRPPEGLAAARARLGELHAGDGGRVGRALLDVRERPAPARARAHGDSAGGPGRRPARGSRGGPGRRRRGRDARRAAQSLSQVALLLRARRRRAREGDSRCTALVRRVRAGACDRLVAVAPALRARRAPARGA